MSVIADFCSFEKACQPASRTRTPLNAVRKRNFRSFSQNKSRERQTAGVVIWDSTKEMIKTKEIPRRFPCKTPISPPEIGNDLVPFSFFLTPFHFWESAVMSRFRSLDFCFVVVGAAETLIAQPAPIPAQDPYSYVRDLRG